jgi:hypothetical protein
LNKIRDFSNLESNIFTSESQRDSFDHDYTTKYVFIFFIFFDKIILKIKDLKFFMSYYYLPFKVPFTFILDTCQKERKDFLASFNLD